MPGARGIDFLTKSCPDDQNWEVLEVSHAKAAPCLWDDGQVLIFQRQRDGQTAFEGARDMLPSLFTLFLIKWRFGTCPGRRALHF